MIEWITILVTLTVVIFVSRISKNSAVSLFLGMFFIVFSYMIVKTAPHLRHEHDEEFSLSHFVDVLAGNQKLKLVCPVCEGKDISIFMVEDEGNPNVSIKCNVCKSGVTSESITDAVSSWQSRKPQANLEGGTNNGGK